MKAHIKLLRLMSPNRTQIRDRVHGHRSRRVLAGMRTPWVCYSTPNLTQPQSLIGKSATPFTDEGLRPGQIWCAIADPRYTHTCQNSNRSPPKSKFPYLTLLPSFHCPLLLTALGVLRMLPVLQRLDDAYGLQFVSFMPARVARCGG